MERTFQVGDEVLVLLPLPGLALHARFSGPYVIESKLSDTDYVVKTPDRRRKSRVCHVNMLKPYVSRSTPDVSSASPEEVSVAVVSMGVPPSDYSPEMDGLFLGSACFPGAHLKNSEWLCNMQVKLAHLSPPARRDVISLIQQFPSLFSDIPSRTTVLKHDIDVGDNAPVKQHAYRVNPTKHAMMKAETDYLMENGLAVPSCSPWCSPCILVPKPDRSFRFCTDYRKVNALTKADAFPLPRMEDCVDRIGSAKFVTKLDLLKGYWQVPLTPRASEISAFSIPDRFLQYTVMAFGLKNAPATFQRLMSQVLGNVDNCEVYLDDVVVFSDTWSSHVGTLSKVLANFQAASLTLNLAKCEFGQATVTYLGKQVGQGVVRPVEAKVESVASFPAPKTKRELRRFLGMAGYYRSFCKNFSDVVLPLTNLLRGSIPFVWSSSCQAAFESVKLLLCSAPVLSAPDFKKPFKLEVDASGTGAGAVLIQEDIHGIDHPVSFFSRKFNRYQLNYSTIEKEALALLLALQYFEVYIGSCPDPVMVFTDHNPLVFLSRMSNNNQRLMRWSLVLQSFNLEIRHKKGSENVVADSLSRGHN